MVELLGYAREEFLGKELWEIGVLTDAEASREVFRALQAAGHIWYDNFPLQTKAGARRDVRLSVTSMWKAAISSSNATSATLPRVPKPKRRCNGSGKPSSRARSWPPWTAAGWSGP